MQQQPPTMQQEQQQQGQQQLDAAEEQTNGEESRAAVADTGDAAAPSVTGPSTAQLFHTDGLHCLFSFLALSELPSVACLCRAWCNALYGAPARKEHFYLFHRDSHLMLLVRSPLRYHLNSLTVYSAYSLLELQQLQQLPSLTVTLQADTFWDVATGAGAEQAQSHSSVAFFLAPYRHCISHSRRDSRSGRWSRRCSC